MNGKAAGIDGVLPEFIKHIGPKGKLRMAHQSFLIRQKHNYST